MQLSPDDVDALCNLGLSYLGIDLFDQAERCFHLAISLDSDDPKGHLNYGAFNGLW